MLRFLTLISGILFLLSGECLHASEERRLRSVENENVSVCTGATMPSDFNSNNCTRMNFEDADPQHAQIWVKTHLAVPQSWLSNPNPLGLYIFGKTSSEVFFNGQLIGQNGVPGDTPDAETPGKMDTMFHVPHDLLELDNEIVLNLSSHHGYIRLAHPIHFIGVGDYGGPDAMFDNYTHLTIALLGALLLGTFYFGTLSLQSERQSDYVFLFALGVFASTQLFAELSRNLLAYEYPTHDLRLITITACSFGFGICLMGYIANQYAKDQIWLWMLAGAAITLPWLYWAEGYDEKTAYAVLIPASCATLLLGWKLFKSDQKPTGTFSVFALFVVTSIITLNIFHNLTFYLVITGMIAYLFIQQAKALAKEKKQRREEEQQVQKLNFKLEQIEQQSTPSSLTLTNSGEVVQISTDKIQYCKAAGDYVELHLVGNREQLYSGSLKSLEDQLPSTFLKVHRSYIVNLEFVSKLISSSKTRPGSCLILENETEVPVSRRVMPMVRQAFQS